MAEYVFSQDAANRGRNLLALLGSHWSEVYEGSFLIESYLDGRSLAQTQALQNLLELINSLSRFDTPLYHRQHWHQCRFLRSQLGSRKLRFEDGAIFGPQPDTGYTYQFSDSFGPYYLLPSPENLTRCSLISNRLTEPSVILTQGADFICDDTYFFFRENPFNNELVPQHPVYNENNEVIDQAIVLWLYNAQFDWNYLYDAYGYALGLQMQTSQGYKDILNAVFDALAVGTNARAIDTAVSALTGVPATLEQEETIHLIVTNDKRLQIVTDKNSYTFPAEAAAIVSPGETVHAGQQLTDLVQIDELSQGQIPQGLQSLVVTKNFLGVGYLEGLVFENKLVPLQLETVNGATKASFELGGFEADVQKFWDEVHARGIAGGLTFARTLDSRGPNADTEPTQADLPAVVNPLELLIGNTFRYNVVIVRVRHSLLPEHALGVAATGLFRKIVPPWTAIIFVCELQAAEDQLDPSVLVDEDPETLLLAEMDDEEIDPVVSVDEEPTLSYEEGVCDT
jgi:hypothetical protein